jgi:DNA-binding XRE family transcriptional regulator
MPKKALDSKVSDRLEWSTQVVIMQFAVGGDGQEATVDGRVDGQKLRELRLAANVTLEQLASEVGLSAATLCLTERGQRALAAERALDLVAGLVAIRQKRRAAFERLLREIGHDPAAEDWTPAARDTAGGAG